MPRLEDSAEYKNAARLAKVGPETWKSWVGALESIKDAFLEVTKDAPVGSLLRASGVGVPSTNRSFNEQIKEDVINYGIPQAGVIKGLKGALRKGSQLAPSVRKTIAQERATRSTGEGDWFSRLLRGTPYHGGGYELYPQLGEHFNPKLFSTGKVGEPNGMSVTYDPDMYRRHNTFAKAPQKNKRARDKLYSTRFDLENIIRELETQYVHYRDNIGNIPDELKSKLQDARKVFYNIEEKIEHLKSQDKRGKKPFARVFPFFRDKPESVVVKGWKGGGDDDLLKQAYEYAVQQTPEIWTKQSTVPNYSHIANILETDTSLRNKFNSHLTQYLQSQGKQALLYMPQRYDEWELRVFDPRDVMMLDIRKPQDPAFGRMMNLSFRRKEGMNGPFKGTPTRKETLKDWERAGKEGGISGHFQAGLGRIYEDIDLPSMQKWSPQVASSTAEEVKTKILADSINKRKEGLRLGSTEPSRLRKTLSDSGWDYAKTASTTPAPNTEFMNKVLSSTPGFEGYKFSHSTPSTMGDGLDYILKDSTGGTHIFDEDTITQAIESYTNSIPGMPVKGDYTKNDILEELKFFASDSVSELSKYGYHLQGLAKTPSGEILPEFLDNLTGKTFSLQDIANSTSMGANHAKQLNTYFQDNYSSELLNELFKPPSIKIKPKTPKKKISLTPPEDDFIVDISDDPLFAKPPTKSKEKEWKYFPGAGKIWDDHWAPKK